MCLFLTHFLLFLSLLISYSVKEIERNVGGAASLRISFYFVQYSSKNLYSSHRPREYTKETFILVFGLLSDMKLYRLTYHDSCLPFLAIKCLIKKFGPKCVELFREQNSSHFLLTSEKEGLCAWLLQKQISKNCKFFRELSRKIVSSEAILLQSLALLTSTIQVFCPNRMYIWEHRCCHSIGALNISLKYM